MTTLYSLEKGEIWLAYLEFSDHPGVGKVRPILILEVNNEYCLAVAAKITSKDGSVGDGFPSMRIPEWESVGLRKPSFVRLDQVFEVHNDSIIGSAPLGKLPDEFLKSLTISMSDID